MSEAFEELAADNNPLSPIDWRAVSGDLRQALEHRNAEIARLRAELAEANRERDAMRAVVAGLRADVSELHADVIEVNDEAMEVAASLDAEEIARLQERISELYRGQKNQILSAKSVEYDIGTLQEEIARLRELLDNVIEAVAPWSEVWALPAIRAARAARAPERLSKEGEPT
jgi:chromosome segregation ATPase